MAYTKRTCHYCGYRDIQPNMSQVEIEYTSGSSNTGLPKRTVGAWLLGNEKAAKDVGKYLLHPNKRTYKRRRKVWICNQCANPRKSKKADDGFNIVKFMLIIVGLFIALVLFGN